MISWYEQSQEPAYWRRTAERCDKLAAAADRDGDTAHAEMHRREAAERRERARQIEVKP